ncbi:MAG TPA: hypothetical protein VFE60_28555 [Roseiarcus sp.]|nr:hypothetical protein [Roseiarcus sp.]
METTLSARKWDFRGTSISDFFNNIRRLRPSLGNGRLPDFHCKSVTIAPLAPYAPKAKTASECGEVRGSKHSNYLVVIIYLYDQV